MMLLLEDYLHATIHTFAAPGQGLVSRIRPLPSTAVDVWHQQHILAIDTSSTAEGSGLILNTIYSGIRYTPYSPTHN